MRANIAQGTIEMDANEEYQLLVQRLADGHAGVACQMFGKQCIKVSGKAAVAMFQDCIVCKLPAPEHAKAMALENSILWDPSGKGRAMKEWVQVELQHKSHFSGFAGVSAGYVS